MITYALAEFTDITGVDWAIHIKLDQAGLDTNLPFNVGPDGFVLSYDHDELDRAKPIVGSRVQFTMYHPEANSVFFDGMYDLMDVSPEGLWQVHIYRDPDGANTLYWLGEIMPEQLVIPDTTPHAPVTITAVDGIGNLKGIKYNNAGTAYTGEDTVLGHLHNCLTKLQTSNAWSGSDTLLKFFEDFIGDEYKDHIGAGQNQQLKYAKVAHSTFHNIDDDGIKQYYSSYEVLESIAKSFNASVFMAEGVLWFVPLGAIQSHATAMAVHHELKANGTVTYNTVSNTEVYTAFGSGSSIFDKLTGWERTSSPAFKEVLRVRDYQGDKPIVKTNIYTESDLNSQTLIDDEDASYSSGTKFVITGLFKYQYDGVSTTNGERAARVQLNITLKVGDAGGTVKYLNRTNEYSEDVLATATFLEPATGDPGGPTFDIETYQIGVPTETTWETAASEYEGPYIVFNKHEGIWHNPITPGGVATTEFQIITPELPADADGLQLSVEAVGIDFESNTDTDLVTGTADFHIENLAVHIYDSDNSQEFKTVDIKATNTADARYLMSQGSTLIGDNITDNDLGTITIYNGTDYVDSTEWTSLQSSTANLSINGLGVRERLGANKTPRRIERGTLFRTGSKWIQPYTVLQNADHSNNYYQVVGLRYIAARAEYDIACMYLSRDITGITVDTDNHNKGPKGPSIPGPLPVERVSHVEINTAEIEAFNNRIAGGGFRDGDGQLVAQAELGDDTSQPNFKIYTANPNTTSVSTKNVELKAPNSMASSYSLEFPLDNGNAGDSLTTDGNGKLKFAAIKPMHTIQSSFYNNNSFGRYIPIGGSLSETTTWNYISIFPCPADGKLVDIAVWTQASTGSTDISMRLNGSGTNTDTVNITGAAGTVQTAQWGAAATFRRGDELAIYFNPTNVPYGVSIAIRLEYT